VFITHEEMLFNRNHKTYNHILEIPTKRVSNSVIIIILADQFFSQCMVCSVDLCLIARCSF